MLAPSVGQTSAESVKMPQSEHSLTEFCCQASFVLREEASEAEVFGDNLADVNQKLEQVEGKLLGLTTQKVINEAMKEQEDRLQKFTLCQNHLKEAARYYRDAILEAYPNHQVNTECVVASLEPSLLAIFTAVEELEKETVFEDSCKAKAEEVLSKRIAVMQEQQHLLKKRALLMQGEDSETERLIDKFKLDRHILLQQRASTTAEAVPEPDPAFGELETELKDTRESLAIEISCHKNTTSRLRAHEASSLKTAHKEERLKDELAILKTDLANKEAAHKTDKVELATANSKIKALKNQLQSRAEITPGGLTS